MPQRHVGIEKGLGPEGRVALVRLSGALDDLAAHMDTDQLALSSLTEDHK